MTTSDSRPAASAGNTSPPLEAWLTPIGVAALTSGVASCLGTAVMYMSYYQHRYHTLPNTPTGRMTLFTYFGWKTFLYCLGWSLLFALSYREWPALRRVTARLAGMLGIGLLFGTTIWAVMNLVVFRGKHLQELPIEVIAWLGFTVFRGLPIVWAVRRFSPLEPPRPLFVRHAPSPANGWLQIIAGIAVALPALLCMHWLTTDPRAGDLMILAFFIYLGAVGVLVIATSLILSGIWTMFGLPGRLLVQLSPYLLVAGGAWFIFNR